MDTTMLKVNTGIQEARHLAKGAGEKISQAANRVSEVVHQAGDRVSHLSTGAKATTLGLITAALAQVPGLADGVQQATQTSITHSDVFKACFLAGAILAVALFGFIAYTNRND